MRNQKAERLVALGLFYILFSGYLYYGLFSKSNIYLVTIRSITLMSSAAPCSPYRLYK